ncbi:MAG TPA: iron ABC transporter permease [Thermoanaerobaculia bacterium]|nr:iron ABC transporter permease [Thermoanaerobaculia bacterium]
MVPGKTELRRGLLLLSMALILSILIGISVGGTRVTGSSFFEGERVARLIVLQIRLPRVLVAGCVGAILAMSGATFQTLLRNPLADPFVLGVSGGAACAAAIATALGFGRIPGALALIAFGGALAATFVVLMVSRRHGSVDSARLLLAGLVLNALFSALILLALSVLRGGDLTMALRWMMGTFFASTVAEAEVLGIALTIAMGALWWISRDLRLLSFGEEDARARGVNTERTKVIAFIAASLATGAAVSAGGIIGFVGLLTPHFVRRFWSSDYRISMPLAALAGAVLLILADALSRVVVAPAELPVGALTALLGVPFFLMLVRRSA